MILIDFHYFQILVVISSMLILWVKAWFSTSLKIFVYDHLILRIHDLAFVEVLLNYKIKVNRVIHYLHYIQNPSDFLHFSLDEKLKQRIHPTINPDETLFLMEHFLN